MTLSRLSAHEISPDWLDRLESCFLHERGRRHGLMERFPVIFGRDTGSELWLSTHEGAAVSGLVTLPRAIESGSEIFNLWTVGLVHTVPAFQGKGLALQLLRKLEARARRENVVALLLWAYEATLYERAGFQTVGSAWIGEFDTAFSRPEDEISPNTSTEVVPVADAMAHMRRVARKHGFAGHRTARGWSSMPFSADYLVCAVGDDGYALAGLSRDARTGYLYEMVGSLAAFPDLWACLGRIASNWTINAGVSDPADTWMKGRPEIRWRPNQVARCLFLDPDVAAFDRSVFGFPFFDWI
jgi:GNAT superfamily N-acetyltransferase